MRSFAKNSRTLETVAPPLIIEPSGSEGITLGGKITSTSGDDVAMSVTIAHASLAESDDGYSNGLPPILCRPVAWNT